MSVLERKAEVRALLERTRAEGKTVGFVPTMGFLHEGHLALVERAVKGNDLCVVSIFVNPLQFESNEDLTAYPRDLERDLAMLEGAGVEVVFTPLEDEMYPGRRLDTRITVGPLSRVGEGAFRPGHFDGVATVCTKLLSIVGPCRAYLGRKDAQQVAVLIRLVRDLDLPVEIVPCPTVREQDGLAMSSRNVRLGPDERRAAAAIPKTLFEARDAAMSGTRSAAELETIIERGLQTEPLIKLQYVEVVDPATFLRVEQVEGAALITLAAFVGSTRLIDNVQI
ncbi:MAG TPA: pantoate--beta-alanine ligase [Actinomycetota bacterium]|nr:pantoate--beta-alanine ligase [Actinomycetota bacterium]